MGTPQKHTNSEFFNDITNKFLQKRNKNKFQTCFFLVSFDNIDKCLSLQLLNYITYKLSTLVYFNGMTLLKALHRPAEGSDLISSMWLRNHFIQKILVYIFFLIDNVLMYVTLSIFQKKLLLLFVLAVIKSNKTLYVQRKHKINKKVAHCKKKTFKLKFYS